MTPSPEPPGEPPVDEIRDEGPRLDLPGDGTAELTSRTVSGLQWTYLRTIVASLLQIVVSAILARLLTPAAFGLLALGTLALRFVDYFARGGVTQAVVQKADLDDEDIRAAFVSGLGLATFFVLVAWVAAPLAAAVFTEPDLTGVLRWLSLNLLFFGAGATAEGLLRREMKFRTIATIEVTSYVVGYAGVGLILAARGFGVTALIAATLTQTAFETIVMYAVTRHPLRPGRRLAPYRAVLGFGSRVSVISFLEFLGDELDTMVVGRFAGTSPVGIYNRAFYLVRLPIYHLTTGLSSVLFPAFSSIQDDVARLRRGYLTSVRLTAAIIFPLTAGVTVAAREVILVLLGDQWIEAASLIPWLGLASAISMITHFSGVTAEARAALNAKLAITTAKVVMLLVLLALAVGGPLWRYGAALAAASVFEHVAYLWLMSRELDTGPWPLVWAYVPALAAAALVGGAIGTVRMWLVEAGVAVVGALLIEMATGAVVLWLAARFGPLRGTRREVASRLHRAGVTRGSRRLAKLVRAVVGPP